MSAARPLPGLTRARPLRLPSVAETTLDNGLRVIAVRRAGVPLVELRLRVPFAGPAGRRLPAHVAQAQLLSDSMLLGTDRRDAAQLAQDLQGLGGELGVGADADRLALGGSVLATGLPGYLALLAELLVSASYPKDEVLGERDRLVQELAIYRSQPSVIAQEALLHRLYGEHPYGRELPEAADVAAVRPRDLRELHRRRVAPAGAVLTLVGDLAPARLTALAAQALSGWVTVTPTGAVPELPVGGGGASLLIDRPGSVQSTIRMARPAPARTAPDYAALALANLVFGGYFSSRWVANIREDKGYTYSPRSAVEHHPAGSRLTLSADVATAVTAPAMLETAYELGRIATVAVPAAELDQARRYAIGSLALGTSSQAGLASTLSQLAAVNLGVEWLREHQAALGAVGVDDVAAAGLAYFAPAGFTTVVVGDADQVGRSVEALGPIDRA